jgi:uncharacterized protein (TIGR03437 family)
MTFPSFPQRHVRLLAVKALTLLLVLCLGTAPASAREGTNNDIRKGYLRLLSEGRRRVAAVSTNTDVGNVAIIQDDGTLITPVNLFDLANRSLLFTPMAGGGYTVAEITPQFILPAAQVVPLTLKDDDSYQVAFGFPFPFYSESYTSIFLNSDGNLTFNAGDISITARDLGRALAGPPRLMPFFQDLNPSEGGTVTAGMLAANRAIFTWTAVPLCCIATLPAPIATQTFQVILSADGSIQYNYGAVQGQEAIVGISPGGVGVVPAADTAIDFSQQTASSSATSNAITEVFSASAQLCLSCLGQHFYATHEDAYDEIVMFSEFPYKLESAEAFSESNPIRNDATGIAGLDNSAVVFDGSSLAGSRGRLQQIVEMGAVFDFPSVPSTHIPSVGENTGLSVLLHELGHRWLAYALYPFVDPQSTVLLGRALAHWSFFFNTFASFMEGNQYEDNGNGTFTTTATVSEYSPLDRYLMGLIPPEQVPDSYVITNTSGPYVAAEAPATGDTVTGTKTPVTMPLFVQGNGPRLPPAAMSQKSFNVAFVLLTAQGATPAATDIALVDTYRSQIEAYWDTATGNSGTIHTELVKHAQILPLPLAAGSRTTTVPATLHLQSPAAAGGATFQLLSSDATVVHVPAAVTVAAGATDASFKMVMGVEGIATITASSPGYETVTGAASSTVGAVVNGASFAAGAAVSPGSIASFFSPALTSTTVTASGLPLPTTLAGVSVTVNGQAAPLLYARPGQINFQAPFETLGSYATLVATGNNGQPPLTVPLLLTAAAPGLFTVSGTTAAAAINAITNAPVTVAHAGDIISFFATGLGAVNPSVPSGTVSSALSRVVNPVSVTIGGVPGRVGFAGLAPGFVGLYQINVTVPAGVSGSAVPVVLSVAGASSNGTTLSVQ